MGLIADIHKDLERGVVQMIVEYRGRLRSEAVGLCKDETAAEDLVFRTFERVLEKIDTYKEDTNLFGWMCSIMENIYRNDIRRPVFRGTTAVDADELEKCAGVDWGTDEQILSRSDSEAIRKAIAELKPKHNKVLMMHYYKGLSLREIANVMQLPMGTVSRRLQIAHRMLAGKLGVILGRTKKPLAVIAAVLSFSFISIAAVVTGWFVDGDDGGTGVPPVQAETFSEQKQEDATPTQPIMTATKKENTMNIRKFTAMAGATMLGMTSGAITWNSHSPEPESWFNVPSLWNDGDYPQPGNSVTIRPDDGSTAIVYIPENSNVVGIGGITLGGTSFYSNNCELQVRPGVTLISTGNLTEPSTIGATLSAFVFNQATVRANVLQIGRGTKSSLYVTNAADFAVATCTLGWLSPTDAYVEDSSFAVTNGGFSIGSKASCLTRFHGRRANIWVNGNLGIGGSDNGMARIVLDDNSKFVLTKYFNMGKGHNGCRLLVTNSVFAADNGTASQSSIGLANGTAADSGKTNYVEVVGSEGVFSSSGPIATQGNLSLKIVDSAKMLITNRISTISWAGTVPEGSVQDYFFSNSTVTVANYNISYNGKMNFAGAGEVRMRQYGGSLTAKSITSAPKLTYELENGILDLRGWTGQDKGKDVFDRTSFHGSRLVLKGANQEYRCHILMNKKTQYVYEIDRTGFNPIKQGKDAGNSNNWVRGAMTVKLTGGLQLLQRKSVEFFHSYNLAGDLGAFDTEEGAFVDPNPQLWACGPHRDPSTFETYGPFKGTGKMGAVLADRAEIASDAHMAEGRSCGWVKMPLVRKPPENPGRVYLDLVPQEGTTLDELIVGFTAAGYPAKKVEMPNANVRIEIPPELIQPGNGEQVVVFDFNEYPDRDACLNGTPTVRAKVRCIKVVKPQVGLILFLL